VTRWPPNVGDSETLRGRRFRKQKGKGIFFDLEGASRRRNAISHARRSTTARKSRCAIRARRRKWLRLSRLAGKNGKFHEKLEIRSLACKRRQLEQRRTGGVGEQKLSYRGVGKSVGIPVDFRRATLEFSGRIRGSNEGEHVARLIRNQFAQRRFRLDPHDKSEIITAAITGIPAHVDRDQETDSA